MSEKKDGKWIADLRPDMPVAEAARHVLRVRLEVVGHYLPQALEKADEDPENVHHLRVATRRATAALRIFREAVPAKAFRHARKYLRRLRQGAGAVRDWDVFLEHLKEISPRPPDHLPGLGFLQGHAFAQRTEAQHELEKVGRKDLQSFEAFLGATVAAVRPVDGHGSAATLTDLAAPRLADLLTELEHVLSGNLDDYAHLHQVRIAGKQLRYALEVFVDCFGPAVKETLYPLVEDMQTILGSVHDSYVAGERIVALRDRLVALPLVDGKQIGPGIEEALHWHRDRLAEAERAFLSWRERWYRTGAERLLASAGGKG